MTLGPFYVNSTPLDDAVITITDTNGEPRNLTGLTPLGVLHSPDGETSVECATFIMVPEDGTITVEWPTPSVFETAGTYLLQIELTSADPEVLDFTSAIEIQVLDDLPSDAPLVGTDEIFAITNSSVTAKKSLEAQEIIGAFMGLDLVTEWPDLTERSDYWLTRAIAYQAAWTGLDTERMAGVQSVKTGDTSITYTTNSTADSYMLAPMAKVALGRIASKTIRATPFIGDPDRVPIRPMWVDVNYGWPPSIINF